MKLTNFANSILDSLHYALINWYNLLILGIIFFLSVNLESLPGNPVGLDLYDISVMIIIILLWFLESGYIFQIVEETIQGSKKPPKFNNIREILVHGINENIVFFIYMLIPIFFLLLTAIDFKTYLKIANAQPDIILQYLNSFQTPYILLAIISALILYYFYMAALLNMAHNQGTIISGFHLKKIKSRLHEIGYINLLIVNLLFFIVGIILLSTLTTELELIPYHIYTWQIGDIITELLITPYITIFAFRMLGLLDQK